MVADLGLRVIKRMHLKKLNGYYYIYTITQWRYTSFLHAVFHKNSENYFAAICSEQSCLS